MGMREHFCEKSSLVGGLLGFFFPNYYLIYDTFNESEFPKGKKKKNPNKTVLGPKCKSSLGTN